MIKDVRRLRQALTVAVEALEFYADPETYFAIGFFPDPPNGDFMEDFTETTPDLGWKPGKRAREAFAALAVIMEEGEPGPS